MIFVEAPPFERIREDYLDDDQFALLQAALMANPKKGDVIKGSGGIRKVRWAIPGKGKGKRGGLRIIYYWRSANEHIYLLTVYEKSEIADLTPDEVKVLRRIVEQIEGKKHGKA